MLDTNIFNSALNDSIDLSRFQPLHHFYATSIQMKEIQNTREESFRQRLQDVFQVANTDIAISAFIADVSRVDRDRVGNAADALALKDELDKLNKNKSKKINSNFFDALIAEAAIKQNMTVVTHDAELFKLLCKLRHPVVNLPFLENLLQGSSTQVVAP